MGPAPGPELPRAKPCPNPGARPDAGWDGRRREGFTQRSWRGLRPQPKTEYLAQRAWRGLRPQPKRITAEAQRQREKQVYISFSLRSLRPLREENLLRSRRNQRLAVQREATLYLSFSATFAPSARGESSQHAKKLTVSSAENAEGEKRSRLHAEPSAAGALTGDFLFWFFRIPPVRAPAALGCLVPRLSCHNLQRYPAKDASEGKIGTVTYYSPRK